MLYINIYYYIYYNIYNNINITFFSPSHSLIKNPNGTMVQWYTVCVNYAVTYQCTIVPFNKLEILFVNA